jgi:hypothetical protein
MCLAAPLRRLNSLYKLITELTQYRLSISKLTSGLKVIEYLFLIFLLRIKAHEVLLTVGSRETGGFVSQSLELRARPGEDVYLPCHAIALSVDYFR